MKTLYQCNPELHERCKKTLCQEECTLTTFEKYAKRDELGNPIIAEKKTGHWEWVQYDYNPNIGNWHCSECRNIVMECANKNEKGGIPIYKYCPNCGARMQEVQE